MNNITPCVVLDSPAKYADKIIVRTDTRCGSGYDER